MKDTNLVLEVTREGTPQLRVVISKSNVLDAVAAARTIIESTPERDYLTVTVERCDRVNWLANRPEDGPGRTEALALLDSLVTWAHTQPS